MTIMLSNPQRAGLVGMIRGDLKSGGILEWLALVNCRVDENDLVVQYCMDAVIPSPACILHDNTIFFDRQGVHCLKSASVSGAEPGGSPCRQSFQSFSNPLSAE